VPRSSPDKVGLPLYRVEKTLPQISFRDSRETRVVPSSNGGPLGVKEAGEEREVSAQGQDQRPHFSGPAVRVRARLITPRLNNALFVYRVWRMRTSALYPLPRYRPSPLSRTCLARNG
jgi:hypothetical protein